ncbi:MAG: hypothetical protein IT311_11300 [Anaerolineales bacterium]|nr:hypothetical protein [Anaerolineales bacterium]MCZ2121988.1 DUF1080 domain-containing protein [Anaerolineales bacterium]
MMKSLNCPNCGAALPAYAGGAEFVACEFCKTSFRASNAETPKPDFGALLFETDFSQKDFTGWNLLEAQRTERIAGNPPQLKVAFDPKGGFCDVLESSGLYDNVDIGLTFQFMEGKPGSIYGAIFTRYGAGGGYGFLLSPQGSYALGYHMQDSANKMIWKNLLTWTKHSALRAGLNEKNRLRVICNGDRLKIYLNGVLATSISDSSFEVGRLYVTFSPGKESNIVAAISDLQLREALS